jgi:hypothetical protein
VKPGAAVVALYALLAALVIPVFPHFPSPNEFTRWALVVSVVDGHTIEVSRAAALLGPQFEDLAVMDGRVYSNKAPGAALAALPGYLVVRPFIGPPSRDNLRPALTAMRWSAATLPLLLLGWAFRRNAPAAAALLFATPLFAYGLLLFSHALVAAALFGAWRVLFDGGQALLPVPRPRTGKSACPPWIAGALLGLAVASEYPILLPALILVALAPWRNWWKLALGGAPFAILLGAYHYAAFGSVFALPSAHEKLPAFRALAQSGLFGVGVPSPRILAALLFDPARGLLLFSPVVIAGVLALRSIELPPRARLALILVPLSIVAVYSGYPNWHGGWNVGPRYIVSALPFLLYPLQRSRLTAFLIGMSAAATIPLTLTFPFPDRALPLPWATLAWPLLRDGLVAPNLLHLIARPLAIAVPFAIALAALAVATQKRFVLVAAGIAVMLGASAIGRPKHADIRVEYVREVYFERGGPLLALPRARRDLTLPPASWPF